MLPPEVLDLILRHAEQPFLYPLGVVRVARQKIVQMKQQSDGNFLKGILRIVHVADSPQDVLIKPPDVVFIYFPEDTPLSVSMSALPHLYVVCQRPITHVKWREKATQNSTQAF